MQWDGSSAEMTTKEKRFIVVVPLPWRIVDPRAFFEKLRDERTAQSRLETILKRGAQCRRQHDLIEWCGPTRPASPNPTSRVWRPTWQPSAVQYGRTFLQDEIHKAASKGHRRPETGNRTARVRLKRIIPIPLSWKNLRQHDQRAGEDRKSFVSEGEGKAAERMASASASCAALSPMPTARSRKSRARPTPKPRRFTPRLTAPAPPRPTSTFLKTMETYKATIGRDTPSS